MSRFLVLLCLVAMGLGGHVIPPVDASGPARKVVFLAGTKSHGPGDHEYEKGLRILANAVRTSPDLAGWRAEVHPYGWPEDPKTLEDADAIVVYADGSDHRESDHPLLEGDRLEVLRRRMRKGAGLVLLHYATFAPVKRGGPDYLEWVGGHFDYETGPGANRWASAIQFHDATPRPNPAHPAARGLQPFRLRDEYYYRMRFRPEDPRRTSLLEVDLPGEASPQTVAWTVQRADGGRGFAFTGGHVHANWRDDNLRKLVLNGIVWSAGGSIPITGIRSAVPEDIDAIRILLVTGKHHPAHDWRATTAALREVTLGDDRMRWTVVEDPEELAGDLSGFDAIAVNYCNWESPTLGAKARGSLLRFVRSGGGLFLLHFANGAWRDWPDWHGGLSRRVWVDGKANHDAYGAFTVHVADPDDRIVRGVPDFVTTDELYCAQVGSAPVKALLTARSRVTGKDEPLAYAYAEGKGRVFQTLLGHDAGAVRTPAHAEVIRRAVAWVARREILPGKVAVTPPAPETRAAIGRFGGAKDGRSGAVAVSGHPEWQEPPLTVEAWIKLDRKENYNLVVANSLKSSPRHWEMYTEAGSGRLAVYVPGASPTNVVAEMDVCDGGWHHVLFAWLPGRIRLLVDGNVRADAVIGMPHATATIGPLWIAGYPPEGLGCAGLVDAVRIRRGAHDGEGKPSAAPNVDSDTLASWSFDEPKDGAWPDAGPKGLPMRSVAPPAPVPAASAAEFVPSPWPAHRAGANADWPVVGNDPGGMRKASVAQVHRGNVGKLKVAWTFKAGDAGGGTTIECTPIVVDGVMYLTTVSQRVVALDAATGKPIWRFDAKSGGVNRGVAYWSDGKRRRIVFGSGNGMLWSLDARTGRPDPAFGVGGRVDLRSGYEQDLSKMGYGVTSAPAVCGDVVVVPIINTEGQPGAPGDIRAFDIRNGRERWRFHTVPKPWEFGNETWGDGWRNRSGTNPWSGFTYDAKNGIVFCATGSPASDFYGADRPGTNLFGNCTLALDARTGKRLWHFQTVHHDVWDHDNPCPPVLVELTVRGKRIEAVAQPTKTGFVYVFERKTGKPLHPVREVPAPASDIPGERTWPTQPHPTAPPALARQGFTEQDITNRTPEAARSVRSQLEKLKWGRAHIPPSVQGTVVSPGFHGGATWSGASFDPDRGLLYINTNDVPYISVLRPNASGGFDFGGYTYFNDHEGYPAQRPPWGWLNAVDLAKGTIAWRIPFGAYPELEAKGQKGLGAQSFGGTIVTAGGLVFIGGSPDEKIRAFDSDTGKELWSHPLPAGGYATPCTYMVGGRQFVVIAAGGGGKLGTRSGDSYIAFALP